jgi:hypothetical protein
MRLLVTTGLPLATGIIGASIELAWPTPTRPGDYLHVELEVTDVRVSKSEPSRGFITAAYETLNQRRRQTAHHSSPFGVHQATLTRPARRYWSAHLPQMYWQTTPSRIVRLSEAPQVRRTTMPEIP